VNDFLGKKKKKSNKKVFGGEKRQFAVTHCMCGFLGVPEPVLAGNRISKKPT
jgi:hypothetical protein